MKARTALSALLALTTLTAVACDDNDDDDTTAPPITDTFTANLTAGAERPTPTTSTATASATFNSSTTGSTTTISYTVTITGGTLSGPITAAHIHGPADANSAANPIVTLTVAGTGTTGVVVTGSFSSTGSATTDMAQLIALMKAGNTYINLHTTANPSGEIRGQIID